MLEIFCSTLSSLAALVPLLAGIMLGVECAEVQRNLWFILMETLIV